MWKYDVGVLVTAEAIFGIGFPREEDLALEPETHIEPTKETSEAEHAQELRRR